MAINKVVYGQNTIIDITDTTAVANDVASGKYFYLANGQKISGSLLDGDVETYGINKIITNLRGTTWYFNEVLVLPSSSIDYNINFKDGSNSSYDDFSISVGSTSSSISYERDSSYRTVAYSVRNGSVIWVNQNRRTVSIISGADTRNVDLIAWIQDNAVQL